MAEQDERMNPDMALLRKHVALLGEWFDSVQIFATRSEVGGTVNCTYGAGNWFARYGQVRAWAIREDQSFRNLAPAADDDD